MVLCLAQPVRLRQHADAKVSDNMRGEVRAIAVVRLEIFCLASFAAVADGAALATDSGICHWLMTSMAAHKIDGTMCCDKRWKWPQFRPLRSSPLRSSRGDRVFLLSSGRARAFHFFQWKRGIELGLLCECLGDFTSCLLDGRKLDAFASCLQGSMYPLHRESRVL